MQTSLGIAITADNINSHVEFYCPFTITNDGRLINDYNTPSPETVYHDSDDDYSDQIGDWTPVSGYTMQYGYRGPVMHVSEFLGGGMAQDVLDNPGTYVIVAVDSSPDDECSGDCVDDNYGPNIDNAFECSCETVPVGWMLLRDSTS